MNLKVAWILVAVLGVSVFANSVFIGFQIRNQAQIQNKVGELQNAQAINQQAGALLNALGPWVSKNPDLLPVLQKHVPGLALNPAGNQPRSNP
ncbi:MAG: hypothetical protein SGI71_11525 [Verrucomicrobiota bacterium]|nr:hypothetical protein [Verrucomicrobiota bacterium]